MIKQILLIVALTGTALTAKSQTKLEEVVGQWQLVEHMQQTPEETGKASRRTDKFKAGDEIWTILNNKKATYKRRGQPLNKGYYVYLEEGKLHLTHKNEQANELYLLEVKDGTLLLYDLLIHDFENDEGYKNIQYLVKTIKQ